MSAPAPGPLTVTRGDTETVVVSLTDDTDNPINITGRTYAAQFRTSPDATNISATLTCTVTDGANGEVTCVLSAADSAELSPGLYYWDLQENASGTISTLISDIVTVNPDVTR